MPTSIQPEHNADQDGENGQKRVHKTDTALKKDIPCQLIKPLVVSMGLFGLLYFNFKKSKLSSITRAYSLFILLLFSVRLVLLFFAYTDEHFGAESFLKVVVHLWYLQSCLNAVVTYRACSNENRFVQFLLKWSRLLRSNRGISPNDTSPSTSEYERIVRRRFLFFLGIAWTVMFVNIGYNSYFLFNTEMQDFVISPVPSDHFFAFPMKIITSIVHVYMSAAMVFTLIMFLKMAGVIYGEFEIFHNNLRQAISPEGDMAELEWFRRRHEDICQLLEIADGIFREFNATGILVYTCKAMLLLYTIVSSQNVRDNPLLLLAYCFMLVATTIYLLLISYGGGYLNHMAHAPLKTIHRVRVKDVTPAFSFQMTMFLNKLTGEPIGLTAMDMFVIDKPTIVTIAGVFISYFIVLLQFQDSYSASGSTVCNCTGLLVNSTLQCSTNLYN